MQGFGFALFLIYHCTEVGLATEGFWWHISAGIISICVDLATVQGKIYNPEFYEKGCNIVIPRAVSLRGHDKNWHENGKGNTGWLWVTSVIKNPGCCSTIDCDRKLLMLLDPLPLWVMQNVVYISGGSESIKDWNTLK